MSSKHFSLMIATVLSMVSPAPRVCAQAVHAGHAAPQSGAAAAPTQSGQSAFAAIAEIVTLLAADPQTDWSKVDMEALRQHLIDMNNVVLNANVRAEPIASGARFAVTGSGPTSDAIRRMLHAHAAQADVNVDFRYAVSDIPGGVQLTVTARRADDKRAESKIRGLGFIGLLALGEHHAQHHLWMARGEHRH